MSIIYNKETRVWDSVTDTTSLTSDWIIDPVFIDKEFAMAIGPDYWIFNGNEISTPTLEDYTALILLQTKDDMWGKIKTERDRRKWHGGYTVGGFWYHSDNISRIQQISLVLVGASLPANINWKTMSGDFVLMTPLLASQIFQAAMMSDIAIFTQAETHRQLMMLSEDPASYDYLTNWPLIYGE